MAATIQTAGDMLQLSCSEVRVRLNSSNFSSLILSRQPSITLGVSSKSARLFRPFPEEPPRFPGLDSTPKIGRGKER